MVNIGLGGSIIGSLFLPQTPPVLAQVNLGGGPAAFLGVALMVGGIALYFLRNYRPQLARDQDIAFSAIALLCGAILVFQGWRLDPILTFSQFLLAAAAGYFAYEAIKLRGATTEQAKRFSSPTVDDERPVSRVYRAELDDLPTLDDERRTSRRIRGSRDSRSGDDYDDSRRSSSRSNGARLTSSDRIRRRNPARGSSSSTRYTSDTPRDDWGGWGDEDSYGRGSSSSRASSRSDEEPTSRRRSRRDYDADPSSASDYVDYQPIDYEEDRPPYP